MPADWQSAGLRYYNLDCFFRHRFGQRVWKISLDGGFGCPNRDGTVAQGGCVFCDPESFSPSRRQGLASITAQIEDGVQALQRRHNVGRFVAYFQPGTNTYAQVDRLSALFREALAHPHVVGLVVGTRPDCFPEDVLDLLTELAGQTWLCVELGLQSIHDRSLTWMNRGHDFAAFLDAVERLKQRKISIGAHVILGLPGETRQDMLATAWAVARLGIDSVKLHNLYAVKNTPLADMVIAGKLTLPSFDDYVAMAVNFLEELPPDCVIDRLSGDSPPGYLIGPRWCLNKGAIRAAIEKELERRDSRQGGKLSPGAASPGVTRRCRKRM
jgi:radical SAM protein (TIGR01212 family)